MVSGIGPAFGPGCGGGGAGPGSGGGGPTSGSLGPGSGGGGPTSGGWPVRMWMTMASARASGPGAVQSGRAQVQGRWVPRALSTPRAAERRSPMLRGVVGADGGGELGDASRHQFGVGDGQPAPHGGGAGGVIGVAELDVAAIGGGLEAQDGGGVVDQDGGIDGVFEFGHRQR